VNIFICSTDRIPKNIPRARKSKKKKYAILELPDSISLEPKRLANIEITKNATA
jgi:hypothetical protein